ncbi:MAG: sulfatase-like hydrolase/transferase [Elusimicrobiota bacterium]|jgi:membrane-anchored protein YejM (alkaline phosphatase superfamily)|nr:sulfatase-like hydrolase/transferase [Elusimicrobiota bacterium]
MRNNNYNAASITGEYLYMKVKNTVLFVFINYLIWCLLSLRYYFTSGFFSDFLGCVFTFFTITGHLALFAITLFIILLPFCFIKHIVHKIISIVLGSFLIIFFAIDTLVYAQYRFHISAAVLKLFFGPAGREIFIFPTIMYVILGIVILSVVFCLFFLSKKVAKTAVSKKVITFISCFIFIALIGFNGLYAWGKFMAVPTIIEQITYLPYESPVSVNRFMRRHGFEPKKSSSYQIAEGKINYPLNPIVSHENKVKLNILLILVDSLRFDMFDKEIMPNAYNYFQSRKGHAFYFSNHISGGNATQAGVFSLFYCIPSTYWDTMTSGRIAPVFMEELKKQGYEFGIFSSSKLNSPEFFKNVFINVDNLRIGTQGGGGYSGDIILEKDFKDFLSNRDKSKPFFGFLFYDAPHALSYPADYPEKFIPSKEMNYIKLSASTDPEPYFNRYKNSVNFVDDSLKRVFETIKKQGLQDNTIIIISGDHAQELNDTRNNFWSHNANFTKYQIKVPLLIFWNGKKGEIINYRTSHYDIVPTLMKEVLGVQNEISDYSIGYNLFDKTPRKYVISISYTDKAIVTENNISVINKFGSLQNYDDNYNKTKAVDAEFIKEALDIMSKFYK